MSMSGHASPFLSETTAWVRIRPSACHTRHLPTGGMIGQHRGAGGVRARTAPHAYPRSAWWHFKPTTTARQGAVCWLRAPAFRRSRPPPGSDVPRGGVVVVAGWGCIPAGHRGQGPTRKPQPTPHMGPLTPRTSYRWGIRQAGMGPWVRPEGRRPRFCSPLWPLPRPVGPAAGSGCAIPGGRTLSYPDRPQVCAPSSRPAPGVANGSGERVRLRLGLQPPGSWLRK